MSPVRNAPRPSSEISSKTPPCAALRFWFHVVCTALSILRRDVVADPAHITGLALRGITLGIVLAALCLFAAYILLIIVILLGTGIIACVSSTVGSSMSSRAPSASMSKWLGHIVGVLVIAAIAALFLAVEFRVGQWIARRARGREMAVCAIKVVLNTIMWNLVALASAYYAWATTGEPIPFPAPVEILLFVLSPYLLMLFEIPCFIGAIRIRRQSFARVMN